MNLVKFGETLTGKADGNPELSQINLLNLESVETRRPAPNSFKEKGEGIVQTPNRFNLVAKAIVGTKISHP